MKRGLTYSEAIAYVGVKRRAFDHHWRPHLVAIAHGTSLVFDREDLDRLFNELKQCAARADARDSIPQPATAVSSLADRRPTSGKGVERWVVKAASTKTPMEGGES